MQRIMSRDFQTPGQNWRLSSALWSLCFLVCTLALSSACGGGTTDPVPGVCDDSLFQSSGDTCDGTLIFASVGETGICCPKCCTEGVDNCLPSNFEVFPSELACKGECPELLCALDCPGGFAKDEFGCDTCECVESCEPGDTKEAGDGCNTCTCTDEGNWACTLMSCQCPPDPCPDADIAECEFGFQKDDKGCDLCACAPECTPGDAADKECNTCECTNGGIWACTEKICEGCPDPRDYEGSCISLVIWAQNPDDGGCCEYPDPCSAPEDWEVFPSEDQCVDIECPALGCNPNCENGRVLDEKGCETCQCAPVCDPGETKDAGDECNECVCTTEGQWACTDQACPEECPEAKEYEGPCVDVIAFARNTETGTCCVYPDPCSAPENWPVYYDMDSCVAGCQPPACDIDCQYGFKIDANGCEICECKDGNCSPPGLQTPANDGCNTCVCDSNGNFGCTKIGCPDVCVVDSPMPEGCPDGQSWAKEPSTGTCCLYDTCNTPVGWSVFENSQECQEASCDPVVCGLFCENGFKVDENGCEICECNPLCDEGETKEADDGCNTCWCSDGQWACTEIACPTCPEPQDFGDEDPACGTGDVFARNPDDGECCAYDDFCAAPPSWPKFFSEEQCTNNCEAITCLLFCEYGYQLDENGCEVCSCNPPPTQCDPGEEMVDDCNTCFCNQSGQWSCTDLDCESCTPGDTKEADDGCNTCFCNANQEWICTTTPCPVCDPGETKPAGDGCNTCTCGADGQWGCPEDPCPVCEPGTIEINACNTRSCDADSQWSDWTTNNCATCGVPWDAYICDSGQTWGKEPSTGLCCEYPKFCWVPGTYLEFSSLGACQAAN